MDVPTIIIKVDRPGGGFDEFTLRERVIPSHLHSEHYVDQLVERLGWALVDAESLETRPT
jgi:hypothetical protein